LRKTHGDQFTGSGTGDFVGHIRGKYVELELKVYPNRFSIEQHKSLVNVNRTGGYGAGILWTDVMCWLIPGELVLSYKDRSKWIPLPTYEVPRREGGVATRLRLELLTINLGV
jgi:hypothetical protein